jgi:hypothetical protein
MRQTPQENPANSHPHTTQTHVPNRLFARIEFKHVRIQRVTLLLPVPGEMNAEKEGFAGDVSISLGFNSHPRLFSINLQPLGEPPV